MPKMNGEKFPRHCAGRGGTERRQENAIHCGRRFCWGARARQDREDNALVITRR